MNIWETMMNRATNYYNEQPVVSRQLETKVLSPLRGLIEHTNRMEAMEQRKLQINQENIAPKKTIPLKTITETGKRLIKNTSFHTYIDQERAIHSISLVFNRYRRSGCLRHRPAPSPLPRRAFDRRCLTIPPPNQVFPHVPARRRRRRDLVPLA